MGIQHQYIQTGTGIQHTMRARLKAASGQNLIRRFRRGNMVEKIGLCGVLEAEKTGRKDLPYRQER